jgi:hypothetical protein
LSGTHNYHSYQIFFAKIGERYFDTLIWGNFGTTFTTPVALIYEVPGASFQIYHV